jgi:hypothetical protein
LRRLVSIAQWVVLIAPAALVLGLVLRHGVNVPSWDQWGLVDILVDVEVRDFPWTNLLGNHNEHRMPFPKLVMLGLAELTRWNILAELMVSVALAIGSLFVLVALARPVLGMVGPGARLWSHFILSAMLFSLMQFENWLWGWQIQWFLSLLAAVSAVALATWSLRSPRPWPYVAGAIGAAIVCHYSFAGGVAIWGSGALILAFHPRRRWILPVWLAAAAAATALYFAGYERPPQIPRTLTGVVLLREFLIYVSNYLAGPLGRFAGFGLMAGAAFVVFSAIAATRYRRQPELVLPWIALGAFTAANAVITAIGRVDYGAQQGLSSRYVTIGLLLSIALVPLGILVLRAWPDRRWASVRLAAGVTGVVLLTFLVVRADLRGLRDFEGEGRKMTDLRECLLRIDEVSDECVAKLYPNPTVVRQWAKQLQAWGWSGFPAHAAQPPGTILIAGPGGARLWGLRLMNRTAGWLDSAALDGGVLTVTGWARHPQRGDGTTHKVLVTAGDAFRSEAVLVGEAAIVEERPQIAADHNDPTLARSGWTLRVEGFSTAKPPRLRAYLVLSDVILAPLESGPRVAEMR